MEIQAALGQVISRIRQAQGLSQLKLSEKAALHLNTIQAIESGKHNTKITTIFQIAHALKLSPSKILAQIEKKPIDIPTDRF